MVKKKTLQLKGLKEIYFLIPVWTKWFLIPITFLLAFIFYNLIFWDKIFPGIFIAGQYVGGKGVDEAELLIAQNLPPQSEIHLTYQEQTFNIPTQDLGIETNYKESAEAAYNLGREKNLIISLYQRIVAPLKTVNIGFALKLDEETLNKNLGVIAEEVSQDPIYPSIKLVNNEILVEKGSPGSELDVDALRNKIKESLSFHKNEPLVLIVNKIDPSIGNEEANRLKLRAQKLIGKKVVLSSNQEIFELNDEKLLETLNSTGGYKKEIVEAEILKIATSVNREPQNPTFIFEGGRVNEFSPAQDGFKVKEEELTQKISQGLIDLEGSEETKITIEIPLEITSPKIKTGDVNNLGIKELIGHGSSNFRGSITNRIFNIGHASSKFKGVLIPPGQTFSFNEVLGDVSSLTGYKQAFVIKDGKTVLGDGGGVCQVSSTFFRAALSAGLPIIERRAHSYRVGYYEQGYPPGLDATVYFPTTDLKVLNDTSGHILIQPVFDSKMATLTFEFYGTSDGRVAKTTKPVVSGVTPPPEDLYVDDPTLPSGQVKQIDFKAWGAKVTFDYSVERNGEIIYEKTFVSSYRPWQAVFLKGTGPI